MPFKIDHLPVIERRPYLLAWIDLHLDSEFESDSMDKVPKSLEPHACIASETDHQFMIGRQMKMKGYKSDGLSEAYLAGWNWQARHVQRWMKTEAK